MKNSIWALLILIALIQRFSLADTDPYEKIEHIKLQNGISVFLAPSSEANLLKLRVEVGVGTFSETPNEWGLAHLTEHVLFRDKGLKDEMSYLQLITEAGGEANGSTSTFMTDYYGQIPYKKGSWLLETFTKMLIEPDIRPSYVEMEKGTIELERGRPDPITLTLGFNPRDYLYPKYLVKQSFWEEEFGVKLNSEYTLSQEQLSTRHLTVAQVINFYDSYYVPSNLKLFVAGNFNRDEILANINEKWGKLPARSGKPPIEPKAPVPRNKPTMHSQIYEGTPYIYMGTKVWDVTMIERQVLDTYVEYLSHRMMKEIRNKKGQTYSASATTSLQKDFGYTTIEFQTPKEYFKDNIALVEKHLKSEAEQGGLTDVQVKEAVDLYLAKYALAGTEAHAMMSYAQTMSILLETYGTFSSPYSDLKHISTADFNAALKKHFKPERRYIYTYEPAIAFPYDYYLMYFAAAAATFFLLRKLMTKRFNNDQIRWIRNVKLAPFKFAEITALLGAYYVHIHLFYAVDKLRSLSPYLESHVLITQYLTGLVWIVSALMLAQCTLAFLPRKLMVMKDQLVIKSVSYFSTHIPLDCISSVEVRRYLGYPFPLKLWLGQVKHRFFHLDFFFWRQGILLHLKSGKSYYFGVRDANKAKAELESFLPKISSAAPETKAA